jgi:hypothetical protein
VAAVAVVAFAPVVDPFVTFVFMVAPKPLGGIALGVAEHAGV